MRSMWAVMSLAVLVLLSGCVTYTLVSADKEFKVGNEMVVVPGRDWNQSAGNKIDVWTLDGLELQQLLFVKGARDGECLFPVRGNDGFATTDGLPTISKKMTPLEVVELYEATMARGGAVNMVIQNFRPQQAGAVGGFRFDFTFQSKDGVERRGAAIGAIKDERIFMAIYTGTRIHYFDRGWDDVQHMFETWRLI